jgi:hypothetical protein
MEVVTALGVVSFALVGLLGMLPIAVDNSRASVSETRSTQLVNMVFSTLRSEPFNAARCFSESLPALKLTELEAAPGGEPPVILYASYDVRQNPQIVRRRPTDQRPEDAIYRIELRFHPERFGASARVAGNTVRLRITGLDARQGAIFESSSYIGNFQRVPFAR